MKTLHTLVIGLFAAAMTLEAHALLITPSSTLLVMDGNTVPIENPTSTDQIGDAILSYLGNTITEVYKQDVGAGSDVGTLASSYKTTFNGGDPSGGTITYKGGPVVPETAYLLVKDGNHSPYFYVFKLTGWNGTEQIQLSNFWLGGGAISHVALLSGPTTTTFSVPDGGATVLLLGLTLSGIGAARRFLKA